MELVISILRHGLMITGFVLIMMLVIEYLNVLTRGNWDRIIARLKWGQLAFCAFLGSTPGCLGAYAVASLYMHRVVTFGALLATMVATCGDESFVMLALFPRTALLIFVGLFAGGIVTGLLADLTFGSHRTRETAEIAANKTSHPGLPECMPFCRADLVKQWRNCSPHRGILSFFLVVFLVGVLSGAFQHGHTEPHSTDETVSVEHIAVDTDPHRDHNIWDSRAPWNWVGATLLFLGLTALVIVATVPDHFLDEHLWHHLVKKHFGKVFAWTMAALVVTELVAHSLDTRAIVESHRLPMLLAACLVGLLPASGPHLVFVTLYAQGAIPMSILLASCIVQDGHGLIPTLSHSRRAFVLVKVIKLAIGLATGALGHIFGW